MSGIPRYIPTKADNPATIMLMDPIQFALIFTSFSMGMMLDQLVLGILSAYLFFSLLKKLKRGAKRGAGQHAFWRSGVNLDKALSKYFPQAVNNEFIK